MMLAPTQLFTYPLCSCALYLAISTTVECALQIHLFLTNKANFRKSQMNVNDLLTMNYGKMDTWSIGKNKANSNPIQSQNKPNTKPNKPNLSCRSLWRSRNKPNFTLTPSSSIQKISCFMAQDFLCCGRVLLILWIKKELFGENVQ